MVPLYGHYNEDTAYMVNDYPYGGKRCRIRYWLEYKKSKGFRFVSQTENPKTLKWNAPKMSTYTEFAACMFLDENGHTKWTGLGIYSEADKCLEFVKNFPETGFAVLREIAQMKALYYTAKSKKPDQYSSEEQSLAEVGKWKHIVELIAKFSNQS